MKKFLITTLLLLSASFGFSQPAPTPVIDKASQVKTTIASFDNNLSGADTTVQKALDTLDNMSSGGTPGGNNTDLQWNDGAGGFGGEDDATWNTSTKEFTIKGYGNQRLQVIANGGTVVGDSTFASDAQSDGRSAGELAVQSNLMVGVASPIGFFTVYHPTTVENVLSATATIAEYGSGNYTAFGYSVQYEVYAYKISGGNYVFSNTPATSNYETDDSSAQQYQVNVSWDPVAGADGYRVLIYNGYLCDNYGQACSLDYYFDTTSTSFIDGDGTEGSFTQGSTVTPKIIGPYLYIDSISGDLYQNADFEIAGGIGQSTTDENDFAGPVKINTTTAVAGTVDANLALIDGGFGAATFLMHGPYAKLEMESSAAAANTGYYQVYVNPAGSWSFGMLNDAKNFETQFMLFRRSGTTPTGASFQGPYGFQQSGLLVPSATVHIGGGSTAAFSAQMKLDTSSALMVTPEDGAIERLTDKLYFTINTGSARKEFTLNDSALTSGKLPVATTNGRLANSAGTGFVKASSGTVSYDNSTYYKSGDTVTFANVTDSALTSGRVALASTVGLLNDSANLTFNGASLGINGGTGGNDLQFGGASNRTIAIDASTTTNGASFLIGAGSALSSGTDLNGGNITLQSGQARGNGSSSVILKTVTANQGTGTTARNAATVATFAGANLTLADPYDLVLGTTTGTKIGTATTQKLGFYNATPIVQPGATTDLGTVLSNLGLRVAGTAYPITTTGAVTVGGILASSGTAPTVANNDCGTTAQGTVAAGSTNVKGKVTAGTLAVTSCAMTFNTTLTTAPVCICQDDTTLTLNTACSATTTKMTITAPTSMSSDVISYICIQ